MEGKTKRRQNSEKATEQLKSPKRSSPSLKLKSHHSPNHLRISTPYFHHYSSSIQSTGISTRIMYVFFKSHFRLQTLARFVISDACNRFITLLTVMNTVLTFNFTSEIRMKLITNAIVQTKFEDQTECLTQIKLLDGNRSYQIDENAQHHVRSIPTFYMCFKNVHFQSSNYIVLALSFGMTTA